jgi:hypothetical protein
MPRISRPARWGARMSLLALIALCGCGSDDALNSPAAAKLKGLATMYLDLAVAKNGVGPANEQELKKHMRSVPDFVLRGNGVEPDAIDSTFISERDQEPFVVLYGAGISQISAESKQVIAHEKTGKNGKRLVVYISTKVDYVDEAKLEELKSAKQ